MWVDIKMDLGVRGACARTRGCVLVCVCVCEKYKLLKQNLVHQN
jgi:hypothetical protein